MFFKKSDVLYSIEWIDILSLIVGEMCGALHTVRYIRGTKREKMHDLEGPGFSASLFTFRWQSCRIKRC